MSLKDAYMKQIEIGKLYRIKQTNTEIYAVDAQTDWFVKLGKRDLILCVGDAEEPGFVSFLWGKKIIFISVYQCKYLNKVGKRQ